MKSITTGYFNEITLLKVMATLFITWFHFKWTAPQQFAPLFIGGAIGNSLFFFASGYLLSFKKERFWGEWLMKKIIRIMPSVWVFMSVTFVVSMVHEGVYQGEWYNWIYPTKFWFVNSILCFFLLSYLLLKDDKRKAQKIFAGKAVQSQIPKFSNGLRRSKLLRRLQ